MPESTIVLSVPEGFQLPPFFLQASVSDIAVALDVAALVVPLATKQMCLRENKDEEHKRAQLEEAVRCATSIIQNEALTRSIEERQCMYAQIQEMKERLDNANMEKINQCADLEQRLALAEERCKSAEERGRASLILENAKSHAIGAEREIKRHEALESELRMRAENSEKKVSDLSETLGILQENNNELVKENHRLRTPSGKGEAGETNVMEILQNDHRIVDTSKIKDKNKYGDILLCEKETGDDGDEGVRVAIEVKHRNSIRSSDVSSFEAKVVDSVETGLFEGGVFISLTMPIPGQTAAVRHSLMSDSKGNRCIPMLYIGTERGENSIAADTILALIQTHVDICREMQKVRLMYNGDGQSELETLRMQSHFSQLVKFTNDMFAEFSLISSNIERMKKSNDLLKERCILMYRSARRLCKSIPWVDKPIPPFSFEKGLDHACRLANESRLSWNNVTNKDLVFKHLGSECAKSVVLQELADVKRETELSEHYERRRLSEKRARDEDEDS